MNIDTQREIGEKDRPLTRADVEQRLYEAGSPDKLDLSRQNLTGIDLTYSILTGANLSGANLYSADLRSANLGEANLRSANLEGANLSGANLRHADLSGANLLNADLSGVDLRYANLPGAVLHGDQLTGADLRYANALGADLGHAHLSGVDLRYAHLYGVGLGEADLSGANLSGANLYSAYLGGANLSGAHLSGANLYSADLRSADLRSADLGGANLSGAQMSGANLSGVIISQSQKEQLRDSGAIGLSEPVQTAEHAPTLRIRIAEEPLTAHNFAMAISVLTELYTKCWLIAKGRLGDLVEYTQTHNTRFMEEANLVITQLRHNSPAEAELAQGKSADTKSKSDSPFNVDVKVEATPDAVMKAIGAAIDGIVQTPLRWKATDQDIKHAAQKAAQESQRAILENEQLELENEKRRLERIEQRLEIQKKGIEYALKIAIEMVDSLYPTANAGEKAMIARTLLPDILQLGNVEGLRLVLPAPRSS